MSPDSRTLPMIRRAGIVLLVALVGWGGWTAFKVWRAWDTVDRVAFDTAGARDILAAEARPIVDVPDASSTTTRPGAETVDPNPEPGQPVTIDRSVLTTFLVIGTDERDSATSLRADVILLIVLPPNTEDVVMMSIPRDLYVHNPCLGRETKVNANLNGCGDAVSGPELMAVAVEDLTGIPIDHFALFDFGGFIQIVDAAGGVEICVGDHAVRDSNPGLRGFEMPAGCSTADGETALDWIRSRKTQILVDGVWKPMPGVTDLTRNQRQQDLMISALTRLKSVSNIGTLTAVTQRFAGAFTIDEGLGLRELIGIVWDARSISPTDIQRPALDVRFSVTEAGESILVLIGSFEENVRAGYENAELIYGQG